MNSTRNSLPNFNSSFSTAGFLHIGWFLTQTKSLSGHLILMSTFLLDNKESGKPGLPSCPDSSESRTDYSWETYPLLCSTHHALSSVSPSFLQFVPAPFSCRGQMNWCMATHIVSPSPFSFPVPSYNVGSSPVLFHSPWLGGFMKSHSYQPYYCKWWSFSMHQVGDILVPLTWCILSSCVSLSSQIPGVWIHFPLPHAVPNSCCWQKVHVGVMKYLVHVGPMLRVP